MAYSGLTDFIIGLENQDELKRIEIFNNPVLEITEVADRVAKSGGKALLFENTGTRFPVLINAFGSDKRMAMAVGHKNLDEIGIEIEKLFESFSDSRASFLDKLSKLPAFIKIAGYLPTRKRGRGICQQVVHTTPDLGILPILQCWPHDGGRYITLPMVHTVHPETGKTNLGMYRMQVLDSKTTAMHWQRHKTGSNHYKAWKKTGRKMPVTVTLGGDPVYTYAATAPLPENIDEYILAGFLRKKRVNLVRCLTNELYVPFDADIVIEGYVDPEEDMAWEGPFGDHTGFYSLADWYPRFHITCITHSKNAVYPATIVGIPPMEDSWIAKATEKIFLSPMKMTMQPEIIDFHMPNAGVAHNLVIVKISKSYPGQGMKVMSSLLGAGQIMFTKYFVVVSGDIDIRDYRVLLTHVFEHVDFSKDLLFIKGPLDVLDHSSDCISFGGKLGIDATVKLPEEINDSKEELRIDNSVIFNTLNNFFDKDIVKSHNQDLFKEEIPVIIVSVDRSEDPDVIVKLENLFLTNDLAGTYRLILVVDHTVDNKDLFTVVWQILGNSDPFRDHEFISPNSILIDGTIKAYRKGGFTRNWPNVVCSDIKTITEIDHKWHSLGLGPFVNSPSLKNLQLCRSGRDEILLDID